MPSARSQQRPRHIEKRDRGIGELPAALLVGAEELHRADHEAGSEGDARPAEPVGDDGGLRGRDADQERPEPGKEIAEMRRRLPPRRRGIIPPFRSDPHASKDDALKAVGLPG
jgi:hypothetical protein